MESGTGPQHSRRVSDSKKFCGAAVGIDLEPVEWLENVCGNTAFQLGLGADSLAKVIEGLERDPRAIAEARSELLDAVEELEREKESVRHREFRERSLLRERIHGDLWMFLAACQEELKRLSEEIE